MSCGVYLPCSPWRCRALVWAISPGSALSASCGAVGAAGATAEPAEPLAGGEPGPEAIFTIDPSIVTIDPLTVTPAESMTTAFPPHLSVIPDDASITTPIPLM